MPRASREQSEATASRVMETARALFVERGYAAVGLEEVAAAAGVTRGAVYHHYASKKALFEAVLGDVQRSVAAAVEEAAAGEPWEQLERGCRAFLTASVDPQVRRVLVIDAPAVLGWETWREHDAAQSGRLLEEVLGTLAESGELRPVSVGATAALLNGAMNEAALWIAAAADPDSAVEEAWTPLALLLRSLRARSTAADEPGPARV
jgi:AcrR family transcriptional regulator